MPIPTVLDTISVARCRDGTLEGHFQAHRLTLPDGRCGVRWGGLVFPLHPGDRIEVTDTASLPGECLLWSPPQPFWRMAVESGSTDAYVFVDGPAAERDRVMAAMTQAGLHPTRSGANMSGTPGDWFIRVKGWTEAAAQAVTAGLGPAGQRPAEDDARLRERLTRDRFEQVAAERDTLRRELADAREQLRMAVIEIEADGAARAELRLLLDSMAATEAERKRDEANTQSPSRSPSIAIDRELATVIQQLLPRIELVRRSMAFVCVELAERAGLWRGLAELDRADRGTPSAWKVVRGADGWIERHFSNGQDNQGRLYARHLGVRWQVLVSHKQEQPSDMRWLAQQG